jgi:hypothetical protein
LPSLWRAEGDMKHHYLPQFYLQGFTDPDTPQGHEPYVWVHRAEERTWERRAPVNVAAETNYYVFTDETGNESQEVEKAFGQIEGVVAPLIREKIQRQQSLTAEERLEFAGFVALMFARVPGQIEHAGNFMAEVLEKMTAMHLHVLREDPRRLEAFKQQYREEMGEELPDLRPEDLTMEGIRVTTKTPAALAMNLSAVTMNAQIIADMGWTFWLSSKPDYFVTSDFPFCLHDPTIPKDSIYGPGLGFKRVEVTMPITREIAFIAGWLSQGTRWRQAPRKIVEQMNYRAAMRASRFLIAPKPTFPGVEHILGGSEEAEPSTTERATPGAPEEDRTTGG